MMPYYIYNFEEGGWNSSQAANIRSARKKERERWKDSPNLTIKEDSFKKVTSKELLEIYASTSQL